MTNDELYEELVTWVMGTYPGGTQEVVLERVKKLVIERTAERVEHERSLKRITALLYLLMRDHLPSGQLVGIINDLTKDHSYTFTAKPMAEYAAELTKRLVEGET
jgi:hypothetical protein